MRIHAIFLWISRGMAVLGGLVLTALILMTVISIVGRTGNGILHWDWLQAHAQRLAQGLLNLGIGPVKGDFELVQAGMAFTIFAFLPLTQISGAHAVVDVFTALLPPRANRALIALWEVVMAAAIVLIAWRLWEGMQGKMRYNETTFLLQFPVWWAYAAAFGAAAVAALVGVYCALARLGEAAMGRPVLRADSEGANH